MSRKTFKYRLYPNRQQRERLQTTLDLCRELYNAGVARAERWLQSRPGEAQIQSQADQLPDIKAFRTDVARSSSQVLQDVLHRVDKTFAILFPPSQMHQKPGFPRFKGRHRYDSFTYPQAGFNLGGKLATLEDWQRQD